MKKACEELKEPNDHLFQLVFNEIGEGGFQELFDRTKEIEKKDEGILTADKSRRKSPGGVFLHLAREKVIL